MEYKSFASGYLVKDGKVLLVHHNKFDRFVPPGGHIEEGENPVDAVVREFWEETSIRVRPVSALENGFAGDDNCTPLPLPFHMGIYREGFAVPHIGYFYRVTFADQNEIPVHQESELKGFGWFGETDLEKLPTFEQVRVECRFVLNNYPKTI